jgi:flagellar assembly factor FliW
MPQVLTRDFGLLDCDQCLELDFPNGLPGFEPEKRFALLQKDALAPMLLLQSLQTPGVCFLTLPVLAVDPEYQIGMTDDDRRLVGMASSPDAVAGDFLFLVILSATGPDHRITANLLAPVVVNLQTKVAVQAVRSDFRYSHQHPLLSTTGHVEAGPDAAKSVESKSDEAKSVSVEDESVEEKQCS